MLDISSLVLTSPDKVYLTSYYISGSLLEFDKSYQNLQKFLVLGGPPPIKSMEVEIGVKIYKLPDDYDDLNEITSLGGYLAFGAELKESIIRKSW